MTHTYVPRLTLDSSAAYLLAEQPGLHRCYRCGRGPLGHDARRMSMTALVWSLAAAAVLFDVVALTVI